METRATTPAAGRAVPGEAAARGPTVGLKTGGQSSNRGGSALAALDKRLSNPRPMTSSKGAGYSSAGRAGTAGGSMASARQTDAKQLEARIHQLLEQSVALGQAGDTADAVDAAKEAARREQKLCTALEQARQGDQVNLELKFAVSLNLAAAYHANRQLQDALNTYGQIIKSRLFPQAGWLRLNMGNIHLEQEQYAAAVKMYRMALDQLPPALKRMRLNVQRNIGIAFLRSGRFQDALDTFSAITSDGPDHQSAFNLALCCWAMHDVELLKQAFLQLVQVPPYIDESSNDSEEDLIPEDDPLQQELRRRQREVDRYILIIARLTAPLLDPSDLSVGFDWCREQLLQAGYSNLGSEVQLAKASAYMARKQYHTAIGILKDFERADSRTRAQAAINLSTLHLLEGDIEAAAACAELCLTVEPDNPAALVSRGNVHLAAGEPQLALQHYEDALVADPQSLQALYNAGLAYMQLGMAPIALDVLQRVLALAPMHAEAMLLLAELHEDLGDVGRACEWLTRLASRAPHDSGSLSRHGGLLSRLEEDEEAMHYHLEAYRVDPTNLDTISWLGAHHVRQQDYAAAIPYFRAAATVQPKEVKWALMVAGCLRRVGKLEEALYSYRAIYATHPTNMECLRYLASLSAEFKLEDDAQKFASELQRVERLQAAAAAAPPPPQPTPATGPPARTTAPSYRPSTSATLAALGGGIVSPFKSGAQQAQQQAAGQQRLCAAPGALELQVTGGRPPTAAHPTDGM